MTMYFVSVLICFGLMASFAHGESSGQAEKVDYILFHKPAGQILIDSKYGSIAKFQRSLRDAAKHCGIDTPSGDGFADGTFGNGTALIIREVASCEHLKLDDPTGQTITDILWRTIAPDRPVPSARRRARAMSFKFEATDYSDIEWNVGTSDDGIITWGPLGATAGQAAQVQRILTNINLAHPDLITLSFQIEAGSIRAFMTKRSKTEATEFIEEVMRNETRKLRWTEGFRSLGEDVRARNLYDAVMDASLSAGIPEAIADFTMAYWKSCWVPTETDYAFFFDRAVQINVARDLTAMAVQYVEKAQQEAGHEFNPAERRRAFAANYTAGKDKWVRDRLGRDVSYYLDGVGREALTDTSLWKLRTNRGTRPSGLYGELAEWKSRSNLVVADYGLSDKRIISQSANMRGKMPACVRAQYVTNSADQ